MVGLVLFSVVTYSLFIGLYFRDLLKQLYTRAHMAIKAAMVERAKRRADERVARAEQKQQQKQEKKDNRTARRAEQQEEAALRRREQHEEAALRREERRVALQEKKEALASAALPQKAEAAEERTALPARAPRKEVAAPLPTPASVRDRITFAKPPVEQPRRLPDVLQEEQEETAPLTTRERRRALFADLEDDAPATFTERQPVPASEKKAKPIFDFDNMPVSDIKSAEASNGSSTAMPTDPMRSKSKIDLSGDRLDMTRESVQPAKVVTEAQEAVPAPVQAADKPAAGSSPLGKLLRRATPLAATTVPAEDEEDTAETDMNYFRRIATNANERPTPDGDRPLSHPDIHPMPDRSAPVPQEAPAEEKPIILPTPDTENSEEEAEPVIVTRVPRASENPFHPQNNPRYAGEGHTQQPQYNGVQDARVFDPSAVHSKSKPVQQQMTVTPAEKKPTPPPPPVKPPYQYPPISLLIAPDAENEGNITAEVQANAEKLVTTLDSFKVHTRVTGYTRGPRITRYEVVPDAGIRVAKISALVEDISMSLASSGIRIEAPIPGKSAVGIEVPNSNSTLVRLRAMLDSEKFRGFPEKSVVCLGGDVTGQPVYCDLAKMPHMLVAGATGMGKSVCINSIIISVLYKASPDEVKLIMIDPKMVEFNIYAGIPHLLVPVVTDPKKAAGALSWAVNEMERRYALIKQANVRNIKDYNRYVAETGDGETLPKIVIIIDELADLMLSAKDAVETSIARLAAKARAAGIHLLIGTQRPSVDVITGTIKSNIPSRIAFHVSSQVDSRTILDSAGAEKLLPHGDMLFMDAGKEPQRVQGAFVDDKEIVRVVEFLKANNEADTTRGEEIMADIEREAEKCVPQKKSDSDEDYSGGGSNIPTDDDDNHLLWAALQVGFDFKKISTSLLQRKLSIGYGKAAKILDALEDQGYISAQDGSKPREILISYEEFKEMMARGVHEQTNGNF
jgi:DNA segregation ATPase FtsK/SpoIIIE-like protein